MCNNGRISKDNEFAWRAGKDFGTKLSAAFTKPDYTTSLEYND